MCPQCKQDTISARENSPIFNFLRRPLPPTAKSSKRESPRGDCRSQQLGFSLVTTMATPGSRAVLRLPRAGAFPRLRSVEAARQGGRRSVAGVTIARRQHSGQVLRVASSSAKGKAPWRRRGASGVGRDVGVLLPRQTARGLTSGVVSTACCFAWQPGVVWAVCSSHCFAAWLLRWKFPRCGVATAGMSAAGRWLGSNVQPAVPCTKGSKLDLSSAIMSRIYIYCSSAILVTFCTAHRRLLLLQ